MPTPPVFVADEVVTAAKMNTLPKGVINFASQSSPQSGITTEVDVTGLSITWTAGSGRIYKISGFLRMNQLTNPGVAEGRITDGSNNLIAAGNAVLATGDVENLALMAVITPSAGSMTVKWRASSSASSLTVNNATRPSWLIVEDIGAV